MKRFLISWFFSPIYKLTKLVAFLFVFFLLAAYIFHVFFELNNLRGLITRYIQKEHQETVMIAGDIKLDFDLLRPSLTFNDVTWEKGRKQKFHADTVGVLIPVLSWKKPEIPEVELLLSNLTYNGQKIGDLNFPTRFTDQNNFRLLIQSDVLGGRAMGVVTNVDGILRLNVALRSIDYGLVLKGYKGSVDANLRLDSELIDFNFAKMEKTLKGDISISGGQAVWPSMGVEFWTSSLLKNLIPGRAAPSEMKIVCFAADVHIEDQWISSQNLVLDSKDLVVLASGRVGYAEKLLDLEVEPEPKDPSLLNLATKVRVKGTWDDPKIKPSKLGVATKIGGVLLSAVNPAALVLTATDFGHFKDTACTKRKEEITKKEAQLNE